MLYHKAQRGVILHAKMEEMLKALPANSFDAVVTDPPYGLKFMGKEWDHGIPSAAMWREVLRVLKPGGHLLAFAGSRTYHRMAVNVEDAGFEIRDQVMWIYGSGFPKSLDVGKAAGEGWQGWGTALKPAHEPIVVARKPLEGTVAANVLKYGVGGLNIDGCRVPGTEALGRFPANIIHDGSDEVLMCFPDAPGQLATASTDAEARKSQNAYGIMKRGSTGGAPRTDAGSAARFFYCAKASKSDRGEGNDHPTVKPTTLISYLVKLVLPPGGIVLDPFAGSCTLGVVGERDGVRWCCIEMDEKSCEIGKRRLHVTA